MPPQALLRYIRKRCTKSQALPSCFCHPTHLRPPNSSLHHIAIISPFALHLPPQTGPRAPEPGYASVCEAYGGFRHLNGYADRPPVRPNISLGDTLAGLHGAFGAVMALLHKQRLAGG